MSTQYLSDRASALVEAMSTERQPALLRTIQASRSDMIARGMSASSMHALEISEACALELREIAKVIWQCIQRVHKSCGAKMSDDLPALFRALLQRERGKLEQTQEMMVGPIVGQLKNMSLLQLRLLPDTYDKLLVQYDAEIAIYFDDLKRGVGANLFERLKGNFLNNKLVAAATVVVVAMGGLASFTDALGKLSSFIDTEKAVLDWRSGPASDDIFDKQLNDLQVSWDSFFAHLEATAGKSASTYDSNKKFYSNTQIKINTLRVRAQAFPSAKFALLADYCAGLDKILEVQRNAHEKAGAKGLSLKSLSEHRKTMNDLFALLLKLEISLNPVLQKPIP